MKMLKKLHAKMRKWMEGGPRRQPARQARLGLEALERREVPATYSPVVVGSGGLFGLSATGQVYESNNGGSSWYAISAATTKATGLVAANGGKVFMLANTNDNINQSVYQYVGVPNLWGRLTDPNVRVTSLVSTGYSGDVYMLSNSGTFSPFWQSVSVYTQVNLPPLGSMWIWQTVSYGTAFPTELVAAGSSVYMLASYGRGYQTVYGYQGGQNWAPLTGPTTHATTLVTSGRNLYLQGSNGPNYQSKTVWQYGGSAYNWTPVTGSNTNVFQLVHGSDGNLYMVASNGGLGGLFPSTYQYSGSGTNWGQPLTGANLQNALATWQLILAHPAASRPYSPATGVLFNTNTSLPSYLDVQQGALGDCWLMASLAEVAARAPLDIWSMFIYDGTTVENGSTVGVYSVRFYDPYGNAQYFTVDTELPNAGGTYDRPVGGPYTVNGSPSPVLWAALAEKAYAEANAVGFVDTNYPYANAYGTMQGGHASWALPAITGLSASRDSSDPSDVASAWKAGKFIVIGTDSPSNPGFVKDHDYAVVGYDPSRSQPFLVFNPWGTDATGWAPGKFGTTYGLCWTSNWSISHNFSTEFIDRFAPGGRQDRHARSSQELADRAFIADLLDPHAKTRSSSGNLVLRAGTVTATGQQLAAGFRGEPIGSGAAPGEREGYHAPTSRELADLGFIEDLLDAHPKTRSGSATDFLPDYARL
jgi:hypothetical protein